MNSYEFPKWLLDYEISTDAKLLYMYLYNLVKVSSEGSVYITADEMEKLLHLSQFKRRKVLCELKEANLIKRINRGTKTRTFVCVPSFEKEVEMEGEIDE